MVTFIEPGPMNFVLPWVLLETIPPTVPWLATSPMDPKLAPRIATGCPSIVTEVEQSCGESPLFPMLGSGVGTKGAGGPGILQTVGTVAAAVPMLPSGGEAA